MNISNFIKEISPTSDERDKISTSGGHIRNTVKSNSDIITDSHLIGSYKRTTKISPIDDLDIIFKVNFGSTEIINNDGKKYIVLKVGTYSEHLLKDYSIFDDSLSRYIVSPVKIINHIGNIISNSYTSTEKQGRNGECYSVYLSSYNLSIDCLPYTGVTGENYKLIPYGGNNLSWKKTNPKLDEENLNHLNSTYDGKVKGIIKILKYWNTHKNTSKKFKSYILESMVYWFIKNHCDVGESYQEILKRVLSKIHENVNQHKNIRGICDYEYMYYELNNYQIKLVKSKLATLYDKLNESEEDFVDYFLY